MDLGDAAAQRGVALHLAQHVGQEHHLAVAGTSKKRELGVAVVPHEEARGLDAGLAAHALQVALPAPAVGRVREHEVELTSGKGVGGEGRAVLYVVRFAALSLQRPLHNPLAGLIICRGKE